MESYMMKDIVWKTVALILATVVIVLVIKMLYPIRVSVGAGGDAPRIIQSASTLQEDFARVAEKCSPAVVVIKTGRVAYYYEDTATSLYNYFHGSPTPRERTVPTGLGSGFFIDDTGHILTNHHIVKQQDVFTVTLQDQTEYPAELVGVDPLSDLAVLKINTGRKMPYLEFADSEKVKVGHWAIAIGAPFSLNHSVTVGIISHKRRTMGLNVYENFIQTDASINQGNSGGPLLDIEGRVIGVNDFILTPSSGNIGLSFAIAGNLARKIGEQLIGGGKIIRPWLGASMAALSAGYKKKFSLNGGVLIIEILRNGPADKGGLIPGDVIIKVDGNTVLRPNDVQMSIANHRPGDMVKIQIFREGKYMDVILQVETMPQMF